MADKSTKLSIVIDAQNKATKGLNSVQSGLDGLKTRAEKFAGASRKMAGIGTVAFAGLTTAIGFSVQAFNRQETANARLEQIAKQVTKATDGEIASFKNLASELQKVGVVGDEVIIAGQSQIASFTKSSKVVEELSDDLADLAVATYGTNVSQEQAIQTANTLGKALQGQLGALTRTGILVNDEFATAFENANTEQERAVILSQIIQDNYGGVNKAMRETAQGGMQALKNAFGDMQEQIGATIIPILTELVKKITPVIESIMKWVEENPKLTQIILVATLALAGLVAVLGFIGMALPAIITGFMILAGPVGIVIGVVGVLTAGLVMLGKLLWETRDGWFIVWNNIKDFFVGVGQFLIKVWENVVNFFIDGINEQINRVNSLIEKLKSIPKIGKAFSGINTIDTFERVSFGGIDTPEFNAPAPAPRTVINVSGNTLLDENAGELVGDQIIKKLQLSTAI